jgi:AraC-like DNA-binding protein
MTTAPAGDHHAAAGAALDLDLTQDDTLLARARHVAMGTFRCAPASPVFDGSGPLNRHHIVFARTWSEIEHTDGESIVCGPGVLTFYNPGDSYRRHRLSPQGDHSDYLVLDAAYLRTVLDAMAPQLGEHGHDPSRFPLRYAPCPAPAYLGLRQLMDQLRLGRIAMAIEFETRVAELLSCTIDHAARFWSERLRRPPPRRHGLRGALKRARVERVKRHIAQHFERQLSLDDLARVACVDACYLARTFREATGTPLHEYILLVRLLASLELLAHAPGRISEIAHQLGFAHHSHFTQRFRERFGQTPQAFLSSVSVAKLAALRLEHRLD